MINKKQLYNDVSCYNFKLNVFLFNKLLNKQTSVKSTEIRFSIFAIIKINMDSLQ